MKIKKIYILFLLAIFSTSNLWATMDETDRNQKPSGKAPALDVAKSFEEIAFERSFELAGRAPALDVAKSFELAADQGDMESQHRLGVMLYQGDGIPKDQERAAKYFQLAADQGYMKSQYSLGICFLNGHGILKDQERAAKYFQLAADQIEQKYQADKRELLEQHYKSGLRMYRGRGDSEDWAGAARIFKELSDTVGHARSQYFLAEMFRYGRGGLPRDSCESERYYKLSADQGVCLAQFEFAKILNRRGKLHESVRYHRRAADGGILEAQYEFAGKLMRGVSYGVEVILPKSPEEAVRYYERAAHRRHKRAQHALGRIFLIGEGVPQNKLEAERYFRMAANQGNTDSQHNLGRMLYYGDGIPKNKAEGRRYLKMARKSFGGKHLKRRMYY